MKNILLVSSLADTATQLNIFTKEVNIENSEILFIPTAGMNEEQDSYPEYIEDEIKVLKNLGYYLNILNIAKINSINCIQQINEAKIICISGGNTFYLLQEIKRKQLLPILKAKIEQGCPYIGESAGSIITAKDITYAQFLDDKSEAKDLYDYSSINVVDFYPLPHYIEDPYIESAQQTFKEYKDDLNLNPINNHQAIIIINDKMKII